MDGLGERAMLEAWLEFHRTTLLLKCEGLDDRARKERPVATSRLSLHGLVRHMAEVERSWFRRVLQRQPDAPYLWYDPAAEDSDMIPLDSDLPDPTPSSLSVYGALLLRGAVASAQDDNRVTAHELLAEAEDTARRLGQDANHCWTAFGPVNATLHRAAHRQARCHPIRRSIGAAQ